MSNTPKPSRCRRSLFEQASARETHKWFVSPSLLGAIEHNTSTERYDAFLTKQISTVNRDDEGNCYESTMSATERIAHLQSQLGCTGMRYGVCCLVDFIELIPVEVEVQVVCGLASTDGSEPELPVVADNTADSVEETIELITA